MTWPQYLSEKARDLTRRLRPDEDIPPVFADWMPDDNDVAAAHSILDETPPPGCRVIPDCPRYELERELVALEHIRDNTHDLAYAAAVRAWEAKGGDWG